VHHADPPSQCKLVFWRCVFLLIAYGAKIGEFLLFYFT
jgi:hypothetical protein